MAAMSEAKRPKEVQHDEAPSQIVDHPFEPRGEWYTLCKHCGLAESAHKETTLLPFRYFSEDMPDDD
jgi:hypothetical protein